jgi:hypothetical protein
MPNWLANLLEVFNDTNKTTVMFLLLVLGSVFRVKGYIDSEGFITLLKTTTVSYFGTSTVIHFTSMIKDSIASKSIPKTPAALVKDIEGAE